MECDSVDLMEEGSFASKKQLVTGRPVFTKQLDHGNQPKRKRDFCPTLKKEPAVEYEDDLELQTEFKTETYEEAFYGHETSDLINCSGDSNNLLRSSPPCRPLRKYEPTVQTNAFSEPCKNAKDIDYCNLADERAGQFSDSVRQEKGSEGETSFLKTEIKTETFEEFISVEDPLAVQTAKYDANLTGEQKCDPLGFTSTQNSSIVFCEKDYVNVSVLSQTEKLYTCQICSYKSKQSEVMKSHTSTHIIKTEKKPVSCEACIFIRRNGHEINEHLIHTCNKPFSCELCPYKAKSAALITIHNLMHTGERPFSCELCPYKGRSSLTLKAHTSTHSEKRPFCCKLCPYKGRTADNLKSHTLLHTGDKPFRCEFCSYKSIRSGSLKSHVFTHITGKFLSCEFCSYQSRTPRCMKVHSLLHSGEKKFSCDFCPYKARTSGSLKAHALIHTAEKPFSCQFCSFKARTATLMKSHTQIHTGERPFSCEYCQYKGRKLAHKKAHISRKHPPESCTEVTIE